jgi:hypothetical protein
MTKRFLLLLSMLAASGFAASGAAAQSARFDGNWSVLVLTEKGECNRVYRFPIVIEDGQARYGGAEGVAVTGSVASNGAVRGSIGAGGASVNVSGRLAGAAGGGTWTAGGFRTCSGRWEAEKRG